VEVSYGANGRKWTVSRIPLNDELRKHLDGSSPDERNACELAVVDVDGSESQEQPAQQQEEVQSVSTNSRRHTAQSAANDDFEQTFDAYGAADSMMETLWGSA
jgi:hypothetical protein